MSAAPSQQKTAVVFSHCHWDIEWYLPFRSFRFWLEDILNGLQDIVSRQPLFRNYMLDGQVAPLDHYLELCPERRDSLKALVRRGALSIGPFYTQFDEWLNSPEAIVRNCLYGNRRTREYGGVMQAGYLPDNFGHPLQMPQILAGFGLDSLLFMRGMPQRPEGFGDEFLWQGLDGTRILAVHLSGSYGNAVAAGSPFDFSSVLRVTPFQDVYRTAEPFWTSAGHTQIDSGAQALIQAARKQEPLCPSGVIPLANGVDHTPPQEWIGAIVERANQRQSDYRFVQADVAELIRLIRASGVALPVYGEELFGSRYHLILTGTLALRAYLKQENFVSEALLEQYAEPLATQAMLSGAPYPARLFEEAWRFLFLNQAHDGIHGSSADAVHVEMRQRYAAVRQVATGICHRSLAFLGQAHAARRPNAAPLLVYAPHAPASGAVLIDTWIAAGSEFHIADSDGRPLPCQVLPNPHNRSAPADRECGVVAWPGGPADTHVVFEAQLAPHDLATFHIVAVPAPGMPPAGLRASDTAIENDLVKVSVTSRGLEIRDKATGRTFTEALEFEDEADAGDAWDFSPTWKPEPPISSRGVVPRVMLVETGPVRASLRMESALRIPRRLQGESRSPDLVDTAMATTIALARSSPVVSVVTEMDNQAQDHRLRMKISTGLNASTVKSQTLFGAIRRPLRHPEESKATADWAQMPPKTFPFREWVVVDDGRVGLAVACRGMYEYESRQEGESVALYITLLRCIGVMGKYNLPYRKSMTSPGNPTPDAQCPGLCRFEFALIPFRPDADQPAPFLSHARAFLYPPIAHQVIAPELTRRSWQPLFALESGRLQVSAVKRAQDGEGVVLRLWENDGRKDRAVVRLSPAIRQAFLCNLNEEVEQELPIRGNRIQLAAAPYKILTLLLLVTERGKRGGAPKACLL